MPRTSLRPRVVAVTATLLALTVVTCTALAATRPGPAEGWTVRQAVPTPHEEPLEAVSVDGMALTSADEPTTTQAEQPATVVTSTPHAAATWVSATAALTAIPAVAVAAYGNATLALQVEIPACHLGWTTLAAIGAVESGHGTHGDSHLDADGRAVPPIVGPALDGEGFAAIAATPWSTSLTGDPTWDHAVGPMQFLPSSWQRSGPDGDGDGVADPQDVDDAALAAARYLCAGDRDLATGVGWHAAVLSYNHSDAYVAQVLAIADGYTAAAQGSAGS